jgi:antitoxin (DNA-binding transcriptional repressor) of toxin-antitoxin stability system
MKTVGVTDLKNNLSRYIKLVKAGEIIFVSNRGKIIAQMHKPLLYGTKVEGVKGKT